MVVSQMKHLFLPIKMIRKCIYKYHFFKILLILFMFGIITFHKRKPKDDSSVSRAKLKGPAIFITEVMETAVEVGTGLCGSESSAKMGLTMIKSMLILGSRPVNLHIFTDKFTRTLLDKTLNEWKKIVSWRKFEFSLYNISFPDPKWYKLYKACSCQRLFYTKALPHLDTIVHIDADVIFFRPVEELWDKLHQFNEIQFIATAREAEHLYKNYGPQYRHRKDFPIYPPFGLQAGVALMNLKRMRQFGWDGYMTPILDEYGEKLELGDQDVINVFFHHHPDNLFVLGCEWNWRFTHCMKHLTCPVAEEHGISLLHGAGNTFGRSGGALEPAIAWEMLTAPYTAMQEYNLGDPLNKYFHVLTQQLNQIQKQDNSSPCAQVILNSLEKLPKKDSKFIML